MKAATGSLERLRPRLVLMAVLTLFCAVAIHKASLAIAPPVYDGLSYYWKSITMLRAIEAGQWQNLLSTEPTMRPPGLLLLNGLFGVHRDVFNFHGFFALNMILPVLLWSLACWIAIPLRRPTPRLLWHKSIAVAALSLLPMFLQFEYNKPIRVSSYWGLQDTALAASAALAMALVPHSLRHRNLGAALAVFFLAGFAILIKPAGILVILSVAGAWIFGAASSWFFLKSPSRRRQHARYCLPILLLGFGILSAIVCAVFFSPYFSKEIIEASIRNQSALVSMTQRTSFPRVLLLSLWKSLGAIWPLFFLVAIPGSAVLLLRSSRRLSLGALNCFLPAAAILAGALLWWRFIAGTEARYILPFFCMAIILVLPAMWTCWTHRCPARLRSVVFGFLAFLVLLYSAALVWPGEIPVRWQSFLGINLSTGGHRDSLDAAEFVTGKAKEFDRPLTFLQAEIDPYSLAFISGWLVLENLKQKGSFKVESEFEWRHEDHVPKAQVIHADFIAITRKKRPSPAEYSSISTYWGEVALILSWLAMLDTNSGIQRHSFKEIDLLEVVDRTKFEAAFDALVESKAPLLRPEFLEYNGYTAGSWQDEQTARTSFSRTGKNLSEILLVSRELDDSRLKNFGECVPLGNDPYMMLKPFLNHGARGARIRIQTTATRPGALQIFHAGQANAFSEAKSVWCPTNKGFNEVTVSIPLEGETTWLRIDVPGPPVETVIRKISVNLLNPTSAGTRP